jgi:hypothetical protein
LAETRRAKARRAAARLGRRWQGTGAPHPVDYARSMIDLVMVPWRPSAARGSGIIIGHSTDAAIPLRLQLAEAAVSALRCDLQNPDVASSSAMGGKRTPGVAAATTASESQRIGDARLLALRRPIGGRSRTAPGHCGNDRYDRA